MSKYVVLVFMVLAMSGVGMAADIYWQGGAVGDFNNAANWEGGVVPGAGDAILTRMVRSDFTAEALTYIDAANWFPATALAPSMLGWSDKVINTWASDGTINLSGINLGGGYHMTRATLNIRCNIETGASDIEMNGDSGDYNAVTFNQYAGRVHSSDSIRISQRYNGVWNLYGGSIETPQIRMPRRDSGWGFAQYLGDIYFDDGSGTQTTHLTADGYRPMDLAQARLNVYGGFVKTDVLELNGWTTNGEDKNFGVVNMAGGSVILTGDQSEFCDWAITTGHIIAGNGAGTVVYTFDGVNTIVTPEPATMAMLAIGALGLIRRRK